MELSKFPYQFKKKQIIFGRGRTLDSKFETWKELAEMSTFEENFEVYTGRHMISWFQEAA